MLKTLIFMVFGDNGAVDGARTW